MGVTGLDVTLDSGVLRLLLDRPEKRNALNDEMVGVHDRRGRAAGHDEAVRVILISGPGDHFCGGFDIVGAQRGASRDAPRPTRRLDPTSAPRAGAPADPVARHRADAGRVRVRGWAAGIGLHLVLGVRRHRRRRRRHVLGAVRRARVHPRQRRHLAAAPPHRRGPRPRHAAARSCRRGAEAASWGSCTRSWLPPSSTQPSTRSSSSSRPAPTVALGLTKWLLQRARALPDRPSPERGVRDGAVVAVRRLPRGAHRVPREARPASGADERYETLLVEREGAVGWLVFDRPDVGNAMNATMLDELERAWHELDADPDVRVIVNTGEGKRVPDRPRRRRAEPRPRRAARAVAPHRDGRARAHRLAQLGVEAGDRGGQRHLRGRRAALRRRRRHRDRVEQRDVPRPARVGRPGHRVRGDRARAEVADGADHAHGADRSPRAAVGASARTSSACLSQVVDPPEQLARRGAGARRDDRPELPRRDARHEEGAVGRARARASPTRAAPARSELIADVGPPRPGGRARSRSSEKREPGGSHSDRSTEGSQ